MTSEPKLQTNHTSPEFENTLKWIRLAYILPWLVLVAGLSITLLAWNISKSNAEQEAQDYFDYRVRDVLYKTDQRLAIYREVLRGTLGLFRAKPSVSRSEFRKYVASLKLDDYFPGIQGVGYSIAIPPRDKGKHIADMRRSGFPEYTIKPAGKRDLYTSIIYLEPFAERNLRAFGFDMYSEPVRREAMERARDTGRSALSGKVLLVQEAHKDIQAGFLIYLPVYGRNLPHDTLAERRANLVGWVYSPFRMGDFMHGLDGERELDLDIHVYDGATISSQSLMYDSSLDLAGDNISNPRYSATRRFDNAGHTWTLVITSRPSFDLRIDTQHPVWIAAAGTILSLLLSTMMWVLVSSRRRAVQYAQKMNQGLTTSKEALHASEAKLRAILENASVAIGWANMDGRIEYLNRKFTDLFGYTMAEIPTVERWFQQAHPDAKYREQVSSQWQAAIDEARRQGAAIPPAYLDVICKDGSIRHVVMSSAWVDDKILASLSDITERKHAEKALQDSKTILQAILDNLPYLAWMKDKAGRFIAVNKSFLVAAGKTNPEQVLGKTDFDLWPTALAERYKQDDELVIANGKQVAQEEQALDQGKLIWTETFKSPILDQDQQLLGITGFARDITKRKLDEMKVLYQAQHDALTGLPNRVLLSDRLSQLLTHARRNKEQLAVLFLDLDLFKPVNDTYGHDIGDLLLQEVAQRLLGCVRESDTVARMGGDEFCILLPSIGSIQAVTIVTDKILEVLRQPFILRGNVIRIAASIGIAVYPRDGHDEQSLSKNADIAMYQAKEAGRNTMKFFRHDVADSSRAV